MILIMPFAVIIPISSLSLAGKIAGYLIMLAVTVGIIWFVLPIVKAMFLNLQIYHRAEQSKFE